MSETNQTSLTALRASLRPGQQELADWQEGPLAVSAVPGSGKSHGMAVAAAIAIAQNQLNANRQLLLVTFTRSAVANLKAKVREHLRSLKLPQRGFSVHTLHGLAFNIASRHPDLSGLRPDSSTLISPQQGHRLIRTCVDQWLAAHPRFYQRLVEGQQFDGEETERLRRQSVLRSEILPALAYTAIHEAKSSGLLPPDLFTLSESAPDQLGILAIAAGLYDSYQQLLAAKNWIDYDDMILAALRVLENDATRDLWQSQIFAVFEDEAQDSSPLQTQLLKLLAVDPHQPDLEHLVRVGDPNQAINSTFTPADPLYFQNFCRTCEVQNRLALMDQAGRSSPIILGAANFLVEWVNQAALRTSASLSSPFRLQAIQPVAATDPQANANPAPEGRGLEIYTPADIYEALTLLAERVSKLFHNHPPAQAAVLVRENRQGQFVAEVLKNPTQYGLSVNLEEQGIEIYEVGEHDRHSHIPAEMLTLIQFLERPHSPDNLKAALAVLAQRELIPRLDFNALCSQPEQFLYPGPLDLPQPAIVHQARQFCCQLLKARLELPHSELIPFLSLALNYDPGELATADKLANRLYYQAAGNHSMAGTLPILAEIAGSERFEPVEPETDSNRYVRSGQLTIITMHKAKGLDWDYVFLPFLHEDTLPGKPRVPTAARFLGEFTLAEVARAQIRTHIHQQHSLPDLATAWTQANYLKKAEEYRLLYVAMTRARRLLWMSAARQAPFYWSGYSWQRRDKLSEQQPCPFLEPLKDYL